MKACFKCKQFKPHDAFYAHPKMRDGVSGKCKECTKAGVRANYHEHIDKYKEYERGRAMTPRRVEARQRYQQTPSGKDAVYRGQRKYATSEHGKQAMAVSRMQYRMNNPLKRAAHIAVGNAIRDGRIKREPCEVCGSEKAQAHHDDYSKPLDVRWLCTTHHAEWHKHNTPICPDQSQHQAA